MQHISARALVVLLSVGCAPIALRSAIADDAGNGLAAARQVVDMHRKTPVFEAPGSAFNIRDCAVGKKMLSIPNTSANPFVTGLISGEVQFGKEIGL